MQIFSNKDLNKPTLVVGLMMGTSIDGVDAAIVKITELDTPQFQVKIDLIEYELFDIPETLKNKIKTLIENKTVSMESLCKLNFQIGSLLADSVNKIIEKAGLQNTDIDIVSSHGQTVYHYPYDEIEDGFPVKSTLQIGEPSLIAELTGITTVADFRPRDIAAGGYGAPLVCFADQLFFASPHKTTLVQNIGGISNVTVVSPKCDLFAFDNGPGNALIDCAMSFFFGQKYDNNAEIGLSGNINLDWVEWAIRQEPYFALKPPKTTGKELFNLAYIQHLLNQRPLKSPNDVIATLTAFTAKNIAQSYENYIYPRTSVDEVVLGGGGTKNPLLKSLLMDYLPSHIKLSDHEAHGISSEFKEAIAFALLGYTTIRGIANNIPACTGANNHVVMGKIIYKNAPASNPSC